MTVEPELTVIIPTLNRPEEFPSAIESAIDASDSGLICVSMNSADINTRSICENFPNPRLSVKYWPTRLSIGDHWSAAVNEFVKTPFFTLIPDDDRITDKNYYSYATDLLLKNPDCVTAFADKRLRKIVESEVICEKVSHDSYVIKGNNFLKILRADIGTIRDICPTHFTTIIRALVAQKVGLYHNCHSPDLILFAKLCQFGDVLLICQNPGEYNWNDAGLSRQPNLDMLLSERLVIENSQFSLENDLNKILSFRLIKRTNRAIFVALVRSLLSADLKKAKQAYIGLGSLKFLVLSVEFCFRGVLGRWPKLRKY
jgi:glycosyltransferase involved in cell wall biosynthesis